MDESQNKIPLPKLIAELCPDGVEFKSINEICSISRGRVMSKEYLKENQGEYPVFSSQTENNGIFGRISTYDYDGEYVTWTTDGAYAGSVFYHDEKFSITNVCGLLKVDDSKILTKFLYYALSVTTKSFVNSGMGNPKLMSNVMGRIRIPVPPMEVQREIVRILDKFTELISLLKKELVARKKQYEYYRNKLLTFGDDVPRVALGEICSKINRVKWQDNDAQFKYIDLSSVDREDHNIKETIVIDKDNAPSRAQQIVEENDILFGTTRPLLKRTAYISKDYDGQICSTGFCVIRVNEQRVFSRFVFHLINAKNFYDYVKANEQGTSYPCISDSKVKDFEIPLPPLSEQKRIAGMLDRFDALCNDLSSGIPAEIAARKKQYEYYRDRLLTFREKTAAKK